MNANSSFFSSRTTTTLTSCTINRVQGNQFNNSNNTTNIVHGNYISCHGTEVVKRTEYSEFRKVIRGDVIALRDLYREDLSRYEWQIREGKILGRLKASVATQIVQLFPHGGTKFTVVRYEGDDAKKVWKRDFQTFSESREPGSPQLFAINTAKIPMLIFHHTESTPVTSMQVKDLGAFLRLLSWYFDDLVKKDLQLLLPSWVPIAHIIPDGARGPMERLDLSRKGLRRGSSPKEWDQGLQQFLHFLHVWGLEIDFEAGKKHFTKLVKIKDSGTIEELDDDDEGFLNNASSSSTKPNSRIQGIRPSTRCNHSNTSQGTGPRTAKPSFKPTQHRQPSKAQPPSPAATAKQVPSRRSDGGTTQSQARNAAGRPAVRTGALGVGTTRRVALDATTTTASKAQSTKVIGKPKPQWR